jgi:hypothetical protein
MLTRTQSVLCLLRNFYIAQVFCTISQAFHLFHTTTTISAASTLYLMSAGRHAPAQILAQI